MACACQMIRPPHKVGDTQPLSPYRAVPAGGSHLEKDLCHFPPSLSRSKSDTLVLLTQVGYRGGRILWVLAQLCPPLVPFSPMSQASNRQDIYLVLTNEIYKDLPLRTVLTGSPHVLIASNALFSTFLRSFFCLKNLKTLVPKSAHGKRPEIKITRNLSELLVISVIFISHGF